MWKRPCNSCLEIRNKRWITNLPLAVFSHFQPQWWTLTPFSQWKAAQKLVIYERGEKTERPWCGGQLTASPLHCGLRSHKCFTILPCHENSRISVCSPCQHYLNNAVKQCKPLIMLNFCSSGVKKQKKSILKELWHFKKHLLGKLHLWAYFIFGIFYRFTAQL